MYKKDLKLNNLQGLICHKMKPNAKHQSHLQHSEIHPKSVTESKDEYTPIS